MNLRERRGVTFLVLSIPTMTEWGMIIFLVIAAGFGSVYYLKRRRL